MKKLLISFSLLFLAFTLSFGQKQKVKFGEIDQADLEMTKYAADTSASAVILYDNGYTELTYNQTNGFMVNFERLLRIKILDKSSLDWADFSIALYEDGSQREKVAKFKGIVHNQINGKTEQTKVGKGDLFDEKISENRTIRKIAMPKVQEGSIIEIVYSVASPFYWNLWDWQYQYDIPVRYSAYEINYPEWFTYSTKFKGYDLDHIKVRELNSDNRSVMFNQIVRSNTSVISSRNVNGKVDYRRMKYGWIAENMPAFVTEAYISTKSNFLASVTFELAATNFPGAIWKSYITTWENLGKSMMESSNFGRQLVKGKTKFLSNTVKSIESSGANEQEMIASIYQHIKQKVAWNRRYSKFVTTSLKDAYSKGKGNVADINLLLVGMYRQAGFEADPVLLSTKTNGFLNQAFPAINQFNYVIARVKLTDGNFILLDATSKNLAAHLLPPRCINDKGLAVNAKGIKWVDLASKGKYTTTQSFDLALNEDMEWEGTMKARCKDYAASYMRQSYYSEEDQAAFVASLESENDGLTISNYTIKGLEEIGKGVHENCEINLNNQVMEGGDLLYFNPMLTYGFTENPFKLEKRTYPVDYPYPQSIVQSFQFKIPTGYSVEELPEKKVIALPEKAGKFSYTAKIQGDKIMVISQFKINKHLFLPQEYPSLREFYNIVAEKHSEQIVLKKV